MDQARDQIKKKIVELARQLGHNAAALGFDDEIPASGLLDSPALLELVFWFENEFGVEIEQDDLNLENFGTINAMAGYLQRGRI